MAEDLLVRQVNRARLLHENGMYAEAYFLLEPLVPQLLQRDKFLVSQAFLILSESAEAVGQYELSFEWLEIAMHLGQSLKARLKKKIRQQSSCTSVR